MDTDPSHLYSATFQILFLLTQPEVTQLVLTFLFIILLLFFSGLMSGSEVAYYSLSPNDLKDLESDERKTARQVLDLISKPRTLLATILISNNFVNILIVILSDFALSILIPASQSQEWARQILALYPVNIHVDTLGTTIHFLITVVGVTFMLILFGEATPKIYGRIHSVALAHSMSGPMHVLVRVLNPVTTRLVTWTHFLERRFRLTGGNRQMASKEEIGKAIDLAVSHETNAEKEIDILKSIVKFGDVSVKQIMRPRLDIVAMDISSDYLEVLKIVKDSGYSRLPVYEDELDHIKGIIYVKDLLSFLDEKPEFDWRKLIRTDVMYVPESKLIKDLLRQFQTEHRHMAIVVDEYGGTAGMLTLEDVLEELIGDIKDEFDDERETDYRKIDATTYIFAGKTQLYDMCRILKIDVDYFEDVKGSADSVAGLILELKGVFPRMGETLKCLDYTFEIVSMTKRKIDKVKVITPPQ